MVDLLIMAYLPNKNKKVLLQDTIIGVNTINHNLNLPNPKGFTITVIDDTNNKIDISNYQNFTNNSFEFTSAITKTNCVFTIIKLFKIKSKISGIY